MVSILDQEPTPTKLYRHFDAEGALLYVGVSLNAVVRLAQHKKQSHWFDSIAKITIESFATRDEALEAETKAIQEEKPKHNIAKTSKPYKTIPRDEYIERSIQASKNDLEVSVIKFGIMYEPHTAAELLNINYPAMQHLIKTKKIGTVVLPAKPGLSPHGTPYKPKIGITGWQLMEYVEHLMESQ